MALMSEKINLFWENFSSTVSGSFQRLKNDEDFCDVALACNSNEEREFNSNEDEDDIEPCVIKAHK